MSARLTFLSAVATSFISLACSNPLGDARAKGLDPICYASPDGQRVKSTLLLIPLAGGGERLVGVTELRTGSLRAAGEARSPEPSSSDNVVRVVEQAKLDAVGRLVHLEATLGPAAGDPDSRVVLDPASGRVRIDTPSAHVDWSVPGDLPWLWASILRDPRSGEPVATPALARVALREASAEQAIRLVDMGALTSHAVTADQIVVADQDQATVVAADDAIQMQDGVPTRLHLAALGIDLEPIDAGSPFLAQASANAGCASRGSFVTR